jgi:hypothetical protein
MAVVMGDETGRDAWEEAEMRPGPMQFIPRTALTGDEMLRLEAPAQPPVPSYDAAALIIRVAKAYEAYLGGEG